MIIKGILPSTKGSGVVWWFESTEKARKRTGLDDIGNEEEVTVANVTDATSWTQELRDGGNITVVKEPAGLERLAAQKR